MSKQPEKDEKWQTLSVYRKAADQLHDLVKHYNDETALMADRPSGKIKLAGMFSWLVQQKWNAIFGKEKADKAEPSTHATEPT